MEVDKIKEEKSLANILKALPDLLRMEQTGNILSVTVELILRDWGIKNILSVLLGTVRKTGLINSITGLLNFKLERIAPNLFISVWDVFEDKEAIITEDKRFTYKEMKERVFRLANGLQSLGLKPKDTIAELLYNGNECFEVFFAGSLIGCPVPLMNWHMNEEELIEAVNRGSPKVLILDKELAKRVTSFKDRLKTVENYVVVGKDVPEGMISYEELILKSPDKTPEMEFIAALNPYTAGTTGVPKNVNYFDISYALSDIAEIRVPFREYLEYLIKFANNFYGFNPSKIDDKITHNVRCLVPTPMYHAGTMVGWVPFWIPLGGTAIVRRKFDPEEFLRLIDEERGNWVFVSPTMLQRIMALPDEIRRKYDLSPMRCLICAAAPCPPELKKDINNLFIQQGCEEPGPFIEFYGSTETTVITILRAEDFIKNPKCIKSVGKVYGGDLKIFDDEKGEWAPFNKEGRILSRTITTINLVYTATPEKLESAFKIVDGVPWFDDGLFGYMDEDGFVYLTTREKEIIISGGVNIYPGEIENVILKHPKVLDVGVVRAPDKDLGEVPAAVIQLKEGESSTEEEIIDWCKTEGLYGYKVPRIVEFVKELPRHIDGKLIKRELEYKYWEEKGIKRRG